MQKAVLNENFFDYLIYLPQDYDGTKKYPLVVYLHGAGERSYTSKDIDLLKKFGPPKLCEKREFNAIIVSPQVKRPWVWTSFPEKVKIFIDEIKDKYSVDENKISITGVSMGCFGLYQIMMDYPDTFCAGVAVCGGGTDWRAEAIKDIPLKIYHGEKDYVVSKQYATEMYAKLKFYGAKQVELFIIPEAGHDIWNKVYEEYDVLAWLTQQKKC